LERKHARRGSVEASGSATDVSGSGVGAVSLGGAFYIFNIIKMGVYPFSTLILLFQL
jgi:hypothetical protein